MTSFRAPSCSPKSNEQQRQQNPGRWDEDHRPFLSVNVFDGVKRRSLRWLLVWTFLATLLIISSASRVAQAFSPDRHIVVDVRSFVEMNPVALAATSNAGTLAVKLSTQFWVGGRQLSPDELIALAPHLSFGDAANRGYSVLLAVPPMGGVSLTSVESDGAFILAAPDLVGQGALEPSATVATMRDPVWLRKQRVVRLRFHPLQFDQVAGTITLHPDILATIDLEDARPRVASLQPDPYWEPIYQQALSNYQDGLLWRGAPPSAPDGLAGPAPVPADSSWRLRITVAGPGLYEIGYDEIANLGMDVGAIDPRRFQLFDGASPLPCLVVGEEDGRLDPGDSVVFYAPPVLQPSRYIADRVFWLVLGSEAGSRAGQRSGAGQAPVLPTFLDTTHHEVQRLYLSNFPLSAASDHWFWLSLRPARSGPERQTLSLPLHGVASGPDKAKLRIGAWGQEEGIARVGLQLAGYAVGAFEVSGPVSSTHEFTIPHALLQSGANEVLIEVSKTVTSTNTVLVDWLEVDYIRRYEAVEGRLHFGVGWPGRWQVWLDDLDATALVWDVTDPARPVALTDVRPAGGDNPGRLGFVSEGAEPLVYETATAAARRPSTLAWAPILDDLRDPDSRADYLIITPDALLPAAQRLAFHRAANGLAVKVITTQTIYDEFNAGAVHPQAIRSFLSLALSQWRAPAPAFAVVMGDATTDPLGYLGPTPIQTPALLRSLDPWLGEVADENAYAAVAGVDIVPDLMVGRLPAGSQADAEQLVDKIILYDRLPWGESWQQRLLLPADNPDGAGDFTALAEEIAALATPSLEVTRLYLANYPNAGRLRADLLARWSEGALIVNYIGHGHPSAWAAEQILSKADAPFLQNQGRPAVVLAMASLSGIFTLPGGPSLLEDLILLPNGRGTIGYVASTGYGISVGNALVNEGFMDAVLADKADLLGRAALQGKLHLYTQGYDFTEYLTQLYTLVGDPATHMPLSPWSHRYYLPLVGK